MVAAVIISGGRGLRIEACVETNPIRVSQCEMSNSVEFLRDASVADLGAPPPPGNLKEYKKLNVLI